MGVRLKTVSFLCLILACALGSCQALSFLRRCIARACPFPPPPHCHYQANVDGCPTCNLICNPASCATLTCVQPCPNGYTKDDKGCNTCVCRPGCYQKACPTDCPHGAYVDSAGCPTCQCRPPPLPCHSEIAPFCRRGVCSNTCACQPFCLPSPNDGRISTGNTVKDFWERVFNSGSLNFPPSFTSFDTKRADAPFNNMFSGDLQNNIVL